MGYILQERNTSGGRETFCACRETRFNPVQYSNMPGNGKKGGKLSILNDSVIICSPPSKSVRKKGTPVLKKATKKLKAKNKPKTYYESPLLHIGKSPIRRELLNIEKKLVEKSQKVQPVNKEESHCLLPLTEFDPQASVIILSDNETDSCETHNKSKGGQGTVNNKTKGKSKNYMDTSCFIISDDEADSSNNTIEEQEEPLPQTSKQDLHPPNAEDIVVIWHNDKNSPKGSKEGPTEAEEAEETKEAPSSPTPASKTRSVGNKKKLWRESKVGNPRLKTCKELTTGQKGEKRKRNTGTASETKDNSKQCQESKGNTNKENNENSKSPIHIEDVSEPMTKKAKLECIEIIENEENTLSFVPKYNVSIHGHQGPSSSTVDVPKFITYTRIDYRQGCSNILTASQQNENTHKKGDLREIIIDGSNIGMMYRNDQTFSEKGVALLTEHFRRAGHTVKVFIPHYRRANYHHVLERLYKEGIVVFTPSRYIGGKRITPYDDRYILQYATLCGGIVISNDQYRDLYSEKPEWRETIEKRLLVPTFVGDYIMFPEDPLGRGGPKLYDFLRH